jgi:hypothetical protein
VIADRLREELRAALKSLDRVTVSVPRAEANVLRDLVADT